jgi:probable phosphoglycerate mutase
VSVRLLLVRHGRVDFTSRDFIESPRGRQYDPPLEERGREQAQRLADRLALMDAPAVVATSPFRRCIETIAPFLHATGLRAEAVDDLGEVFIGDWEGLGFEEIVAGDEEMARRFREQEPMFSLAPGGETGTQLRSRVVPAVERLVEGLADGTVVAVSHGGVINAYLGHVMGIPHDMFFLPENASINSILVDDGRRDVRFLNDVRHLTDPALFAPPAGIGEHAWAATVLLPVAPSGMTEPT